MPMAESKSPPKEVARKCHSLTSNLLHDLPILHQDEIVIDRELGRGGFCTVSAVRRIKLSSSDEGPLSALLKLDGQTECRQMLQGKFTGYEEAYFPNRLVAPPGCSKPEAADPIKNLYKPPRVALKRLRPNLSDARRKAGLLDLTVEVELLAFLGKENPHPNVIALHAVGLDEDGSSVSFLVLDQLRCTLKNKLYKWREATGLGIMITTKALRDLWLERMIVIMRVSSALAFLHKRGVIHRDVNCQNIGFDSDDCVKLFDFGLAKRMCDKTSASDREDGDAESNHNTNNDGDNNTDAIYDMSGQTGTLRYMPPEVYLETPYGAKADVYSLSIVMYQVLSLLQPFANVPPSQFESKVIKGGLRPTLDANWPSGIRDVLTRMWSPESKERPSSEEVHEILESILRGSNEDLYPTSSFQRLFYGDDVCSESSPDLCSC